MTDVNKLPTKEVIMEMTKQPIRVTVWNEFFDEKRHPEILTLYPGGVHEYVASFLREQEDMEVRATTFEDEEFGVPDEVIDNTDVLVLYSHMKQDMVSDERVEKIISRVVNEGMGLVVLHSGLWMKLVQRLVGPGGYDRYREIEERERIWVVNPGHPIAQGLPMHFDFPHSEVYGEPASFPEPDELIFLSWYQGGEAARAGMTWRRGAGNIFYFSPGHATYNTMQSECFHKVVVNGVRWAAPSFAVPRINRKGVREAIEPIAPGGGYV